MSTREKILDAAQDLNSDAAFTALVAMQILAGAQGALMIGRLTGDAHAIDAVSDQFRSYLGYVATK